jgi:hypothetical protein
MQVGSVNVIPQSANHMIVSLNGTIQKPNSSFTVSGSTITFASNLVTNDVIDFIQILGDVLDLGVPSDATVTTAKLVDANVTLAKLSATGTKDATTFLRGDNTFAAPSGGGKVLQVVLATKTDAFTTSNTSSHQATGLSVNITPSATSSKVLILVNGMFGNTVDGEHAAITIKRDSTNLAGGSADLTRYSGNGRKGAVQLQFLDSPSSTSQLAYGVFLYTSGGGSSSSFNGDSLYAHILAIEIGA